MFKIQPPTLKGEIKKARASNYTWLRVISEFIDNSNDVLIQSLQSGKRIQIKLNLDTNDNIHSISISDNFIDGIKDHNIWNWTYERDREDEDCGEFGTGFKSGSVNIASELTVITSNNENHTKMRAEWDDMARDNDYTPVFETIDKPAFLKIHPFDAGSTFLLKQLIKANIPADIDYMRDELISHISVVYKKLLKSNKDICIYVDDVCINHQNVLNEIDSKKIHKRETIPKSEIYVFKNKDKYVPIVKHDLYHYKISFKDENQRKKPNGNLNISDMRGITHGAEIVNLLHYRNKEEYTLIDKVTMESRCIYHYCKKWLLNDKERPDPNGNINLIRKNRILSDKCTAIHYRGDSYATYMYHELTYNDRRMDNPLGVQFNKNTDNKIQSEELEASILWSQKLHEKLIMQGEEVSGKGHREHMGKIEAMYISLKRKINNNYLKCIFDEWKKQVDWGEYERKNKQIEQEQAQEQEQFAFVSSNLEEVDEGAEEDEELEEQEQEQEQEQEPGEGELTDDLSVTDYLSVEETDEEETDEEETDGEIKSIYNMTDEEIIKNISSGKIDPCLQEIKYIIDRGEGSIESHGENQELCELFENERQAYDGIRFGLEFCTDFTNYIYKEL